MSKKKNPRSSQMSLSDILGSKFGGLAKNDEKIIDDSFDDQRDHLKELTETFNKKYGEEKLGKLTTCTQLGKARNAAKKLFPTLFPLTAKQDLNDSWTLGYVLSELGGFIFDVYDASYWTPIQEDASALYLADYFAETKNDDFFTALHAFTLPPDTRLSSYRAGWNCSKEEIGKIKAIIRLRKQNKECRRFFSTMLDMLGEEKIQEILRSSIQLFGAFVLGFQETMRISDDEHIAKCEEELGENPFDIVNKSMREFFDGPTGELEIPTHIPRMQENKARKALDMLNKQTFNIAACLLDLRDTGTAFPKDLTAADCPLTLRDAILKRWKETESNELFFSLLLSDHYGLPYNDFPLVSYFISLYGWRQSDSIIKGDSSCDGTIEANATVTPRFSIDKPYYKTDSRYIEWLDNYQDDMSFKAYCKKYPSGKTTMLTFRQLFTFAATGTMLPSNLKLDKPTYRQMKALGCDDKDATIFTILFATAFSGEPNLGLHFSYQTKKELDDIIANLDRKEQDEKQEAVQTETQTQSVEELQEELRKAQEEKKIVEQRLSVLNHERLTLEKKNSNLSENLTEMKRENAKLKETLFSQKSEDEEKMGTEDTSITFPFTTKKNIIIFGGRENFKANLRSLIPSIRFVDNNKADFPSLIRNADAIYLQTNAMNHPMYDAITEAAKKEEMEIRYLKSSSSRQCALQIAKDVKDR